MLTNDMVKMQLFYGVLASSIEVIRRFCDRIPGLGDLSSNDKDLLYQSSALELFVLRMAYR